METTRHRWATFYSGIVKDTDVRLKLLKFYFDFEMEGGCGKSPAALPGRPPLSFIFSLPPPPLPPPSLLLLLWALVLSLFALDGG